MKYLVSNLSSFSSASFAPHSDISCPVTSPRVSSYKLLSSLYWVGGVKHSILTHESALLAYSRAFYFVMPMEFCDHGVWLNETHVWKCSGEQFKFRWYTCKGALQCTMSMQPTVNGFAGTVAVENLLQGIKLQLSQRFLAAAVCFQRSQHICIVHIFQVCNFMTRCVAHNGEAQRLL